MSDLAGQITFLDEPHKIRNYNVGRLLSRLRPLSKADRAGQLQMIKWGPWGPFIVALQKAARQ
ncbi:hypothetical protein ASE05_15985 [Mesorhizobium sp. Root172]|nr:hypothetical protein ASE05_15985 [Mesorhizobium sp. Root172]